MPRYPLVSKWSLLRTSRPLRRVSRSYGAAQWPLPAAPPATKTTPTTPKCALTSTNVPMPLWIYVVSRCQSPHVKTVREVTPALVQSPTQNFQCSRGKIFSFCRSWWRIGSWNLTLNRPRRTQQLRRSFASVMLEMTTNQIPAREFQLGWPFRMYNYVLKR